MHEIRPVREDDIVYVADGFQITWTPRVRGKGKVLGSGCKCTSDGEHVQVDFLI